MTALTMKFLSILGRGSVCGGLKRLSLMVVRPNTHVSHFGWSNFIANNPECKVRLTISGGVGLVSHSSNLIYPIVPVTHFRSFHSKDMRINFLNSVIGWNLNTLEHLELVDYNCIWSDLLTQVENGNTQEPDSILDPLVYAAWRCSKLHTIKLGLKYSGDSLVGIARLRGPKLVNLEIPKAFVIKNSLTLRKLNKEMTAALERDWQPLPTIPNNKLKSNKRQHHRRRQSPPTTDNKHLSILSESINAAQADELD